MSSLTDLTLATRRLIYEEDSSNSHFTDDEIQDYINQAIMFLGSQMEWALQVATAVGNTGQAVYTLPSDFISLVDVYFNQVKMMVLEREDLSGIDPQWQAQPNSVPRYCYKQGNAAIGLYPIPDATQQGMVIQIQYIEIPAALAIGTDAPNLHVAFHMCLPFYAAFMCEHKVGNATRADFNLKLYDMHRKALMSKLQRFSDDLLRFRWSTPIDQVSATGRYYG